MTDAIQKAREALIANGFDTHTRAIADEFMPETGGRDKAALQIAILDAAAAALSAQDWRRWRRRRASYVHETTLCECWATPASA